LVYTKHTGGDWVICASPELMDMEAHLEDAYSVARAARGDTARHEPFAWIKRHAADCDLPPHGRTTDERIEGARDCLMANMKHRLAELQREQQERQNASNIMYIGLPGMTNNTTKPQKLSEFEFEPQLEKKYADD
jgi:uncharacterized protein YecT (DUF1311 family)